MLGVIHGVLLWADMNAATPLGALYFPFAGKHGDDGTGTRAFSASWPRPCRCGKEALRP